MDVNRILFILIMSILSLTFVSADFGYNNPNLPKVAKLIEGTIIAGNITTNYYNTTEQDPFFLAENSSLWAAALDKSNSSYAQCIPYAYNQTYSGSTYNSTYHLWSYNQSDSIWHYNQTYSGSTYNSTYHLWSYNQTYSGSTYNSTYSDKNTSQWIRTGGNIYYQNLTGRVGIGTTSPTDTLNVVGSVNITGNTLIEGYYTNLSFGISKNGEYITSPALGYISINSRSLQRFYADTNGNDGSTFNDFEFYTNVSSSTTTGAKLVIRNDGNVGIGTSSPTSPLEVFSSSNTNPILRVNSSTDWASMLLISGSTNGLRLGTAGNLPEIAGVDKTGVASYQGLALNGANLTFKISNNPKMYLDANGNLGIGTQTPAEALHTYLSTTGADGILIEQASTGDAEIQFLITGVTRWGIGIDNSNNDAFQIGASGTLGTSSVFVADYNDKHIVLGGSNVVDPDNMLKIKGNSTNAQAGAFAVYDSADIIKFRIRNDGNVGIGTSAPQYPLHVAINTSTANGSIAIYANANISASGYITHTAVWDSKLGTALSQIKDSNEYFNLDGTINHKADAYSYVETKTILTDEFGAEKENIDEGWMLDKKVAMLEQALYEMKSCIINSKDMDEARVCIQK